MNVILNNSKCFIFDIKPVLKLRIIILDLPLHYLLSKLIYIKKEAANTISNQNHTFQFNINTVLLIMAIGLATTVLSEAVSWLLLYRKEDYKSIKGISILIC